MKLIEIANKLEEMADKSLDQFLDHQYADGQHDAYKASAAMVWRYIDSLTQSMTPNQPQGE